MLHVIPPDDTTDYAVRVTAEQVRALGDDGALILRRAARAIDALAALRSGTWRAGAEDERAPTTDDWIITIAALTELTDLTSGITAAAIREHAHLGGSIADLGIAMRSPKGTAQNRRQAAIGTSEQPVAPARAERWARGQNP